MKQSLSTYPDKQNYNYIININVIKPSAMISYNEKLIKFYIPRLPSLSIRNPAAITTAALLKEVNRGIRHAKGTHGAPFIFMDTGLINITCCF